MPTTPRPTSTPKPKPTQPEPTTWPEAPGGWPDTPGTGGNAAGEQRSGEWPANWQQQAPAQWPAGWPAGSGATPGGLQTSPFALAYAKHLNSGGQVPGFGLLGSNGGQQPQGGADSPGQAAALPGRPPVTSLGLPEVLAACSVAVVGGLLARTWSARTAK
ncbi:MAG: hypothetical protein ACRDQF_15220 [Thermocrispum sp.]